MSEFEETSDSENPPPSSFSQRIRERQFIGRVTFEP